VRWALAATLLVGCGGGNGAMDGGSGSAGRGGAGGSSGPTGAGARGGTTGVGGGSGTPGAGGGSGTTGVGGSSGSSGTTGSGGASGTTGMAGRGGSGGTSGAGGATGGAGRGGSGGTTGAAGRGGAGGAGGTSGGSGGATGAAGGGGGTAGSGGSAGVAGSGGAGGGSGNAGGGGRGGGAGAGMCGSQGMTCSATQHCDWLDNRCGRSSALGSGECVNNPSGCGAVYEPVCGCDGQVYSNACVASAAGQDVSETGGCTPPPNMFACGTRFCPRGTHYCHAVIGGPAGAPGSFSCVVYPASCGDTPTCACLSATTCGGSCVMQAAFEIRTTCFAP
jgi:hypothetical protein